MIEKYSKIQFMGNLGIAYSFFIFDLWIFYRRSFINAYVSNEYGMFYAGLIGKITAAVGLVMLVAAVLVSIYAYAMGRKTSAEVSHAHNDLPESR